MKISKNKLGLSSAKLSRIKLGCLEVIFELVFINTLNLSYNCLEVVFDQPLNSV